MTTTTDGRLYQLGAWNPAGARVLSYATAADRDADRDRLRQAGFTTWNIACTTTR